ncbi:hypothetical protein [Brevundimonas sp. NIBR11]|uniref:hypothetical protein n=1 Tax=Brevundimonas sp. NIBR11 TaxID=3015999 RepID=UPI0022F13454|nr:hypothetical protein [Brevundimonas sp. NIBR11]
MAMDLLQTIRSDIAQIPDGEHTTGLKSVLHHVEAAYRHLERGQKEGDDSAFNDAIYRTNQAFEGSVKEAYRVFTEQDPAGKTPAQIEKYLEQNSIFKDRVLSQLKDYRTNWRNPSTHDYNLFFDQDEAFLAIVSVSAFAKLLVRQIAEHISYTESIAISQAIGDFEIPAAGDLSDKAQKIIEEFFASPVNMPSAMVSEASLQGALSAYITTALPNSQVDTEVALGSSRNRADIVVTLESEKLIIELKRWRNDSAWIDSGATQVMNYLQAGGINNGIVLFYEPSAKEYHIAGGYMSGEQHVMMLTPSNRFIPRDE